MDSRLRGGRLFAGKTEGKKSIVRGTIFRGNVSGGEGWGRATTRDAPTGEGEGDGFSKVTNEVQNLVRMVPWESNIDKSPLKRGVRLPDYKPSGIDSCSGAESEWV